MATPEVFDYSGKPEMPDTPLAEVIQFPGRRPANLEVSTPASPIERISLPDGEIVPSAFLVKDGLVRNWLRESLVTNDITNEQAVTTYRMWNNDPEFTVEDLFR